LSGRTRLRNTIHTRFDGGDTRTLPTCRGGDVFVGHAVAIVIEAVASLVFRQNFVFAGPPGHIDTGLRACFALPYADRTCSTRITVAHLAFGGTRTIDSVVDFAIAVFIRAVARFRHRSARYAFGNHTSDATFDHYRTSAQTARRARKTIVGLSVAIVIDAIARFGAR
jgi:hypothetical protein